MRHMLPEIFITTAIMILLYLRISSLAIDLPQQHNRPPTSLNTARYATSEDLVLSEAQMYSLTQPPVSGGGLRLPRARPTVSSPATGSASHQLNQLATNEVAEFTRGMSLDDEDERLLENFYSQTKQSDPFLDTDLSLDSLWDSDNAYAALQDLDGVPKHVPEWSPPGWDIKSSQTLPQSDAQQPFHHSKQSIATGQGVAAKTRPTVSNSARYSPVLKLLTTYDPINHSSHLEHAEGDLGGPLGDSNAREPPASSRIVGATLFGRDDSKRPQVNSMTAQDAIRLHDSLMDEPPRDGKVRVRMYYHRAIHDDAKLYGTGPWKYWGHGWGVEFGYDPRKRKGQDDEFYQRGYTIERAFGRDFCRTAQNCRKLDPNFFNDPLDVGTYSRKQHYEAQKPMLPAVDLRRLKPRGKPIERAKFNEYRY